MTTKTNPKVAFYIRSANGDADNLNRQKQRLETFITQKPDLANSPVEIYTDEIQSGLRPGPEFLRMRQDIIDDKINVVMVSEMDRISRSPIGLLKFLNIIKSRRLRFLSPKENMDTGQWRYWDGLLGRKENTNGELKLGSI